MRNLRIVTYVIAVWMMSSCAHRMERSTDYKVASFNLRMDTPRDSLNAWTHRKEMVKDLLVYHDLDIIGTQEGFIHQLRDIDEIDYLAFVGVGRDDGEYEGEHSAIFYNTEKFEAVESGDFWYSENPDEPGLGWDAVCCNRICSWVKLKDRVSADEFFVFNSHFDHEGVQAREESAKLLVSKIEEIANGVPVIAMGDFNSSPETVQIQTISNQLNDAFKVSKEKPYGPVGTFNSFDWHAPLKNRIDYIFVSDAIEVLKYAVLVDALDMRYPSDHMPVVAHVRLGNNQ